MDTSYDGRHVCGVPERSNGSFCRFDRTNWDGKRWKGEPTRCRITWAPGNLPAQLLPSFRWAWARWAAVCAIEPVEVAAGQPALVVCEYGPIDGGGSTLAWAHLPCGRDPEWPKHYQTRYDSAERWFLDAAQPPNSGIHLGAVACHEIGHLLGLDHDARRGSTSLLAPTYRADILAPQQWDIEQAVLRYGPPFDKPVPPDTPPTPGAKPATIEIDGVRWTGTLTRVA